MGQRNTSVILEQGTYRFRDVDLLFRHGILVFLEKVERSPLRSMDNVHVFETCGLFLEVLRTLPDLRLPAETATLRISFPHVANSLRWTPMLASYDIECHVKSGTIEIQWHLVIWSVSQPCTKQIVRRSLRTLVSWTLRPWDLPDLRIHGVEIVDLDPILTFIEWMGSLPLGPDAVTLQAVLPGR